jgi:iron complex outermembrane receptor protein
MKKYMSRNCLLGTTAVLLVCGANAGAALAQEATGTIETVTVTAMKRAENIQAIPATITAFSADQLASRGVTNTSQLAQSTPGLAFSTTGPYTDFYMRGLGNNYETPSAQSPVAMYVDGVYQADVSAMAFGLTNDVDRIELLKGPQGTLYGRNAVGGAINIITKAPSEDTEVDLQATGGNLGDQEYSGYVNGGNDELQANFAIDRHLRDGYYKNIIPGAPDLDNIDDLSMHGKIRFTPSERVELILAVDDTEQKGRGPGLTSLPIDPAARVVPTGVFLGGIIPAKPWETSQTENLGSYSRSEGISLTGRFHFDAFDIVSITAARDYVDNHGIDESASNLNFASWRAHDFHNQFTQEIQFVSTGSGPFSWISGLYYLHDNAGFAPFIDNFYAGFPTSKTTFPYALSINGNIDINSKVRGDSYAAYAEGTYKLTDELSAIVGGRFSSDKEDNYLATGVFTLGPNTFDPGYTLASANASGAAHTWNAFTPRVSLQYERPEGLYYVTASQGYAAGLYNISSIPGLVPGSSKVNSPINPETINAIEAGAKWQFFDNHIQLDVAGFYYVVKNLQIMQLEGGGVTEFQNANGRSDGVDVDAQWLATSNLTLHGAFEILDTAYTSYPQANVWVPNTLQSVGGVSCDLDGFAAANALATPYDSTCKQTANLKGDPLIQSPKFTSTLGFDWNVPFLPTDQGTLMLTGNWAHSDSYWMVNNGDIVSPAYDMFNANLAYTLPNGQWDVSLWGNNLSDAKYYITAGELNYAREVALAPPRTFGITVAFHFGR